MLAAAVDRLAAARRLLSGYIGKTYSLPLGGDLDAQGAA